MQNQFESEEDFYSYSYDEIEPILARQLKDSIDAEEILNEAPSETVSIFEALSEVLAKPTESLNNSDSSSDAQARLLLSSSTTSTTTTTTTTPKPSTTTENFFAKVSVSENLKSPISNFVHNQIYNESADTSNTLNTNQIQFTRDKLLTLTETHSVDIRNQTSEHSNSDNIKSTNINISDNDSMILLTRFKHLNASANLISPIKTHTNSIMHDRSNNNNSKLLEPSVLSLSNNSDKSDTKSRLTETTKMTTLLPPNYVPRFSNNNRIPILSFGKTSTSTGRSVEPIFIVTPEKLSVTSTETITPLDQTNDHTVKSTNFKNKIVNDDFKNAATNAVTKTNPSNSNEHLANEASSATTTYRPAHRTFRIYEVTTHSSKTPKTYHPIRINSLPIIPQSTTNIAESSTKEPNATEPSFNVDLLPNLFGNSIEFSLPVKISSDQTKIETSSKAISLESTTKADIYEPLSEIPVFRVPKIPKTNTEASTTVTEEALKSASLEFLMSTNYPRIITNIESSTRTVYSLPNQIFEIETSTATSRQEGTTPRREPMTESSSKAQESTTSSEEKSSSYSWESIENTSQDAAVESTSRVLITLPELNESSSAEISSSTSTEHFEDPTNLKSNEIIDVPSQTPDYNYDSPEISFSPEVLSSTSEAASSQIQQSTESMSEEISESTEHQSTVTNIQERTTVPSTSSRSLTTSPSTVPSSVSFRENMLKSRTTTGAPTEKPNERVVFGILPNNTVVKKYIEQDDKVTTENSLVIYGILPNRTVVRKYPNGTIVPDRPRTRIEVTNIDPKSLTDPNSDFYREENKRNNKNYSADDLDSTNFTAGATKMVFNLLILNS